MIIVIIMVLCFSAGSASAEKMYEIIQKGKAPEYLQHYEEEAARLDEEGKPRKAADTYIKASGLARATGEYQKAVSFGIRALHLAAKAGYPAGRARAFNHTGQAYTHLADFEKAIEYFEKGAEVAGRTGNRFVEASSYERIGNACRRLEEPARALEYLKKANAIYESFMSEMLGPEFSASPGQKRAKKKFRKPSVVRTYIKILVTMGDTHTKLDDYASALASFEQALYYSADFRDRTVEAYIGMGDMFRKKKDLHKALEYHLKAVKGAEEMNVAWHMMWAYAKTGGDYRLLGDHAAAVETYRKAVSILEDQRSTLQTGEMRSTFFDQMTDAYNGMIAALIALGRHEEAFNYSERVRARTFMDILGNKVDLSRGRASALMTEELELKRRITALQIRIEEEEDEDLELRRELSEVRSRYNRFLERLRKEDPEHASLVSVEPLTLKELQAMILPGQALLEFHVLPENIIVWTVRREEFGTAVIRYGRRHLFSLLSSFRDALSDVSSEERISTASRKLHDLLLRESGIRKGEDLIIVPHNLLHYLPFHALMGPDGRYLIEDHAISYLSSANLMRFTSGKHKKAGENVLALGNPDLGNPIYNLRYAEREAREIRRLYPGSAVYLGQDATKDKAQEKGWEYAILHFASHGEFNEQNPLDSSIMLAGDGESTLTTADIFRLDLRASLVVLSACETSLGRLTNGDEIVGLTRSFIYAGTPSVISSLWLVNDKSTFILMRYFYQNLRTMSKVAALRDAQLRLMKEFSHPFYWGAFQLTGDRG